MSKNTLRFRVCIQDQFHFTSLYLHWIQSTRKSLPVDRNASQGDHVHPYKFNLVSVEKSLVNNIQFKHLKKKVPVALVLQHSVQFDNFFVQFFFAFQSVYSHSRSEIRCTSPLYLDWIYITNKLARLLKVFKIFKTKYFLAIL